MSRSRAAHRLLRKTEVCVYTYTCMSVYVLVFMHAPLCVYAQGYVCVSDYLQPFLHNQGSPQCLGPTKKYNPGHEVSQSDSIADSISWLAPLSWVKKHHLVWQEWHCPCLPEASSLWRKPLWRVGTRLLRMSPQLRKHSRCCKVRVLWPLAADRIKGVWYRWTW